MKVDFDEVEGIFGSNRIWSGGRELLWYKKVWMLLEKGGLTKFDGGIEMTLVYIRAYTLVMIYSEFSETCFGESANYDFYDWEDDYYLTHFRIGQIFAKRTDDDLADEENDEVVSMAFSMLVEEERRNVFQCIIDNIGIGRESTLFVYLHLSVMNYNDNEEDDDDEGDFTEGENYWENNFEKYEEDTDKYYDDVVNFDVTAEKMAAMEWLQSGTYDLKR